MQQLLSTAVRQTWFNRIMAVLTALTIAMIVQH